MGPVDVSSSWFPVVTLDDAHGEDVAAHLHSWHGAGLLRPFLLVAADGRVHPWSPLWVGQGPVDLDPQSVLARLGARSLTVVSVLGPDGPSEAISAQLGRLENAVARPSDGRWVRLYGVPSDHASQIGGPNPDPRAHHLVVSAEDRVDERSINSAPDASTLSARLALNAAMLAGLFVGQHGDPQFTQRSVVNFRLVRSFARLAVGPVRSLDELVRDVEQLRSDHAMMAELAGGVAAHQPAQLVEEVAAQFASKAADGELTYHPYRLPEAPRETRVTFRVAIQMLWTFVRSQLREASGNAAREALARLQQRAQQLTFGGGSAYHVDLGTDVGAIGAVDPEGVADTLLHNAGNLSVQVPATPTLWGQLRGTALALSDGAVTPDCIELPHLLDKAMLIGDPHLIAPLPDESTLAGPGAPGAAAERRACDPRTALAEGERLRTEPRKGDKGEDLASYDAWLAQRSDSFTWRVATATSAALDIASEQMVGTVSALRTRYARLSSDDVSAKSVKRKRSRRLAMGLAWVGISLIFLASPGVFFAVGAIGLVAWCLLQAGALILVVVFAVSRYVRALRRQFQDKYRLDLMTYQLDNDINSSLHQAREFLRLHSAYLQLVEWSDVLAEVSHRPFGMPERHDDSELVEPVIDGPLSWVRGDAVMGAATRRRLAISCGKKVYGRGWLSNILNNRAHELSAQSRLERSLDPDESTLDADYDVNAQQDLIRELGIDLGAGGHQGQQDLLDQITEVLLTCPLDKVFDAVALPYQQTPVTISQFFDLCGTTDPEQVGLFDDSLLDSSIEHTDGGMTAVAELYPVPPRLAGQPREGKPCILQLAGRVCAIGLRLDVGNLADVSAFAWTDTGPENVTPAPPTPPTPPRMAPQI